MLFFNFSTNGLQQAQSLLALYVVMFSNHVESNRMYYNTIGKWRQFMAVWLSQKQAGIYIFKITFKLLIKVHMIMMQI